MKKTAKKEPQVMAVTVGVAWRQRVELQDLSLDAPHPHPDPRSADDSQLSSAL